MSADAKRRLEKLVILKGGFKTMGQKLDHNELLDKETLRALLLKEGEVYKHSGNDRIFSDEDLDVLMDRYVCFPRQTSPFCVELTRPPGAIPLTTAQRVVLAMLMVSRSSTRLWTVSSRSRLRSYDLVTINVPTTKGIGTASYSQGVNKHCNCTV